MVRFFPVFNSAKSRKSFAVLLAFAWFAGLLVGAIVALSADPSFFSLMRLMPCRPVSIIGLMLPVFLPFLFTAIAVYLSYDQLLIPAAFFKALLLSMLAVGVWITYGHGGWIIAALLFFSDFLSSGFFLWLWYSVIAGKRALLYRFVCTFLVLLSVRFFDRVCITPFLLNLLS